MYDSEENEVLNILYRTIPIDLLDDRCYLPVICLCFSWFLFALLLMLYKNVLMQRVNVAVCLHKV